jgi:hypothetical protein
LIAQPPICEGKVKLAAAVIVLGWIDGSGRLRSANVNHYLTIAYAVASVQDLREFVAGTAFACGIWPDLGFVPRSTLRATNWVGQTFVSADRHMAQLADKNVCPTVRYGRQECLPHEFDKSNQDIE